MIKKALGILIAAIALSGIVWMIATRNTPASRPETTPAALPAGAVAPSAQFLRDFDTYKELAADVAKRQEELAKSTEYRSIQNDQDRVVGMSSRLSRQVPQGYNFDEKLRAFLAPPPAPAPVRAPTPEKK